MGLFMRLNDTHTSGGVADLLDGLRALVEPSARHAVEQREAERQRRDEADSPDLPFGPIDLDAGTVRITRQRPDQSPSTAGAD